MINDERHTRDGQWFFRVILYVHKKLNNSVIIFYKINDIA